MPPAPARAAPPPPPPPPLSVVESIRGLARCAAASTPLEIVLPCRSDDQLGSVSQPVRSLRAPTAVGKPGIPADSRQKQGLLCSLLSAANHSGQTHARSLKPLRCLFLDCRSTALPSMHGAAIVPYR